MKYKVFFLFSSLSDLHAMGPSAVSPLPVTANATQPDEKLVKRIKLLEQENQQLKNLAGKFIYWFF